MSSWIFQIVSNFKILKRCGSDVKYLKKKLILKSVATSSLLEYTGSEIFASGISPTKRQIAFMATLSPYKSDTIFRTRPISNQSGELVLKSRYASPKFY